MKTELSGHGQSKMTELLNFNAGLLILNYSFEIPKHVSIGNILG